MITSIGDQLGRTSKRGPVRDLETAYQQLNDFVDKINDKILNRLQLFQQVYLDDYKDQVTMMSQELKTLRDNLDAEVLQQKSNEKMYMLEEERDFFRAQVMKLNQEVNSFLEENKRLKNQLQTLENEVTNYKTITFNFERKIQKLQFERTQMANFKRQESAASLPSAPKEEPAHPPCQQTLEPKLEGKQSRASCHERKGLQIVRARTYSKIESATKASIRKYEQSNERDHIIDECLKEVKKQIFYRTSEKGNPALLQLQEACKVGFSKFTRTDKKNLVLKLLNNQKMMEEFGDFLTAKNSGTTFSRIAKTKIGDDKFNEKLLIDLKRSFNKKIFDLKGKPRSGEKRQTSTQ